MCLVAQLCWLLPSKDLSPPVSSGGILPSRIPEWVAISFSRGFSPPRDQTQVSCIAGNLPCCRQILYRLSHQGRHVLKDVTLRKQSEPFCCSIGGAGRSAQARQWGWMQGRWPKKNVEFVLHMLKNAESNAELRGLDVDSLISEHVQENKAPRMCCRIYRVCSRLNPYLSSSCHTEMILNWKRTGCS